MKPVIFTVHGTNDHDANDDGERWWQRGSEFCRRITAELTARGIPEPEIVPVRWSGANSDFDRLSAARGLAKTIGAYAKSARPCVVVAHSHGGNIALEALNTVPTGAHVAAVVSFGTPFFKRRLKTVPAIIAAFKLVLALLVAPMIAIYMWMLGSWMLPDPARWNRIDLMVLFALLLAVLLRAALTGWRELTHARKSRRTLARAVFPGDWLVIHSPRDEAMRLLETAATVAPRYVTTASATRSLTAFAALLGVIGTFAFLAYFWDYFTKPIFDKLRAGEVSLGTAADFTFVVVLPVVFLTIQTLVRIFARLGGGWLYARLLSSSIHGGVLGAAFGGDARFRLVAVSRTPPGREDVEELRIEALNLGGIDDAAVFLAAKRLYDSVVAHDGPDGGIGDPDEMWKRLSDALYHNAYMRDIRVILAVTDHLSARLGGQPGQPPITAPT